MSTLLPQVGENFPDFDLPAALPGGEQSTLSLSSFAGKPLVIFFYPKDTTCGCTVEACGFRDEYSNFQAIGAQVVGVSRDRISAHHRFIQNQNLPFPLLADSDQTLILACRLRIDASMYGKPVTKILRTSFALNERGVILKVWEKVSPDGHAREVLEYLQARNGAQR